MKKFFQKIITAIKSTDKGTIYRTIVQILAYINQLVAVIGSTSFASHPAYQWISFIVTLVSTTVSYWYNNDWSNGAILVGRLFKMLRDGKITQNEIEEFMDSYNQKNENDKTPDDNS